MIQTIIIFLCSICILIFLRFPSIFLIQDFHDSSVYITTAYNMQRGEVLYSQTWDHKPPITYLIYYVILSLPLPLNVSIWLISCLFISASLVLIYLISGFVLSSRNVRLVLVLLGSILYGLPLISIDMYELNSEIIFLPFVLGFIFSLLYSTSRLKNANPIRLNILAVLSGGLFTIVMFTKLQALIEIIGILIGWVLVSKNKREYREKFAHTIRFSLVPIFSLITFIGFYAFRGELPDLKYAQLDFNSYYAQSVNILPATILNTSLSFANGRYLINSSQWNLLILVMSCLFIFLLTRVYGLLKKYTVFLYWFVFSFFAVVVSGRNYPHYLLQWLPVFLVSCAIIYNIYSSNISKKITLNFFQKKLTSGLLSVITIVFVWNYMLSIFFKTNQPATFSLYGSYQLYKQMYKAIKDRYVDKEQVVIPFSQIRITNPVSVYVAAGEVQNITAYDDYIANVTQFPRLSFEARRKSVFVNFSTQLEFEPSLQSRFLEKIQTRSPKAIVLVRSTNTILIEEFVEKNYSLYRTIDGIEIWKING
jgi:hypothetical protein